MKLWRVLKPLALIIAFLPSASSLAEPPAPPHVKTLYLVPSDRTPNETYREAIHVALLDLQKWYRHQTDGHTFRLSEPIVEVVHTSHSASWYATHGEDPDGKFNAFYNALADAKSLKGWDPNSRDIWIVYVDAVGATGAGAPRAAVLPEHDLLGLAEKHEQEKYQMRWVGGLGHELGHALGLRHPGDENADAIMRFGYIRYPNCYLTDEDVFVLRTNPCIYDAANDQRLEYPLFQRKTFLYEGGYFVQLTRRRWEERKYRTGEVYHFAKSRRKKGSVYLTKENVDGFQVEIPIEGGMSRMQWRGKEWMPLYEVRPGYRAGETMDRAVQDVSMEFTYTGGRFVQVNESDWLELRDKGGPSYFQELRRSSDEIILLDKGRDLYLRLPIEGGSCVFSMGNDRDWCNLFEVKQTQ